MGVAALAPNIAADSGLTPEAVGLFSGLVWASALAASLSTDSLIRRFGPWWVARLCLLACAAGLLGFAMSQPVLFVLGAVLIGFGQGLEAPQASQLMGYHVAQKRRAFYFSLKQTGVQVGAISASLLLPALAVMAGWRMALVAAAFVLVALALALIRPAHLHQMPITSQGAPANSLLYSWVGNLQSNRDLCRLAIAACTFGATQVCMNTFMVTWMVNVRNFPLATAGAIAATAQGAGLLGRPLWGWVASRSGGSTHVLRGLGALMSLCSLALGLVGAQLSDGLLALLAACFGLSASGWNGVFLSDVASRSNIDSIAATTAAAMVPFYLGLFAGPIAFAAISRWLNLSTGFILLAVVASVGTLLLPRYVAKYQSTK